MVFVFYRVLRTVFNTSVPLIQLDDAPALRLGRGLPTTNVPRPIGRYLRHWLDRDRPQVPIWGTSTKKARFDGGYVRKS